MDKRRTSKQPHEWAHRMKQFNKMTQQGKDVFLGDDRLQSILGEMSYTLQTAAKRGGIPQAIAETIGVTQAPFPYRVWSGKIGAPWDKVTQKSFAYLSRKLRYRFNELYAFIQDREDLTNGTQTGGAGGIGGVVDGNETGVPGTFVLATNSNDIYTDFSPWDYKGSLNADQVDYADDEDPLAVEPDHRPDRRPDESDDYNATNPSHVAAVADYEANDPNPE